jgi:methionyl-tRNA formyltransferase
MRLVFAGTPAVALPSLAALIGSRHDVVAVVSRPDAAAGRGRRLTRSPVADWADAHGVPVLTPTRPAEPDFLAALRELAPDCCPVVAYGALVPRAALDVPPHGWVNLHFSLLPAWRGAAPVQRALMAGDDVTGATTFRLAEGLDTGPVYGLLTEPIRPRDTAGDLLDRLAEAGARLLVWTLDGIEDGTVMPAPQDPDGVSLAPKVSVEQARVDWALPAHLIDRRVRGCTPEPGAWTTLRGERVRLGPVIPEDIEHDRDVKPGEIVAGRRDVIVGTGTGTGTGTGRSGSGHVAVRLGEVQGHGKRPMPAADWARGLRLHPGEAFE